MSRIDAIISETINRYFSNNIIRESDFGYVVNGDPKQEFIEYIKSNGLNLSIDYYEEEFETPSYSMFIDYRIASNAYIDEYPGSYDIEPQSELMGEDDWNFEEFQVTCFDKETNEETTIDIDDELLMFVKNHTRVDYDGHEFENNNGDSSY